MDQPAQPFKRDDFILRLHKRGIPATNIITSEAGKLAYVPISKNACTSFKLMFYRLAHGRDFDGHFDAIHQQFNYQASDFSAFAKDRAYFKFVVIRDPVDRFISAYNSRVLVHQELSEKWFLKRAPRQDESLQYMRANALRFDPAIDEFIHRFDEYLEVSNVINHHFAPQWLFFYGKTEVFNKIYNMGQLSEVERDIGERIGYSLTLSRVQETKNLAGAVTLSDIGTKNLSKIIRFYLQDYEKLKTFL